MDTIEIWTCSVVRWITPSFPLQWRPVAEPVPDVSEEIHA